MVFALIPAGGKSTRMGRPKLALPLGGRTVLEHVIHALRRAEISEILVIIGPHVSELMLLAQRAGAHSYVLSEATPDMRATVEVGLGWLEDFFRPTPEDDWLLVPADHPALNPEIVRQLIHTPRDRAEKTILVPTYQGRRGHPALIGWKHIAGIREHPAGQGLNAYLRQRAVETLEVPVDSGGILLDLDTPEDYERLQQTWPTGGRQE